MKTATQLSYRSIVLCCMTFLGCSDGQGNGLAAQEIENSPTTETITLDAATETVVPTATGFAVVELFTSQGCSSCPSADANLAHILEVAEKRGQPIYPLSFHVDYWNDLGWEDPFSSERATIRQRRYARRFQNGRIYTPQMVVNGTTEFVGSNRRSSAGAIQSSLESAKDLKLNLSASIEANTISVTWEVPKTDQNLILFAALVQKNAERDVSAGENTGRKLKHVNVVRDFRPVDSDAGQTQLRLPNDSDVKDFEVIAFAQPENLGPILVAEKASIKD